MSTRIKPPASVAIVGATGVVGTLMRRLLHERQFPASSVRLMASARSAGKMLEFGDDKIVVEDAQIADYSGVDIAIFSAGGSTSKQLAPIVSAQGAIVIDNSSAWRMDPEVPLVVPEVNPHALLNIPKGIVANPNCTTMVAMPVLAPIAQEFGLRRVIASTYQAVSGAGVAGISELVDQVQAAVNSPKDIDSLTFDGAAIDLGRPEKFVAPIAFDVVPLAGSLIDEQTDEEHKFTNETRKILELPELPVFCTCVRVPVFAGHSLSLNIETKTKASTQEITRLMSAAKAVTLTDVPTPLAASGLDPTLVGRIRQDHSADNGIAIFLSGDNLRKGAALNAIQIAEELIAN